MSFTPEQIYELLPAIYRIRDAENGEPLKALLGVVAGQVAVLQDNIQQLYADEFIETCARWAVPYIGDLVGADLIYEIAGGAGQRAVVANTIGYRRRKGTLLDLEQVSMDVSGMPAVGVEFFKRLITTQSMRHLRPQNLATLDLRRGGQLDKLDSAFDTINRTIDVRRIAPRGRKAVDPDPTPLEIDLHGGGKYNIPDVGIYLWRWAKNLTVTGSPAFVIDSQRYMFSPLGQNLPLFTVVPPRESFSGLTTRLDVPQPIRRREFNKDIAAFYGPSFSLTADGAAIDSSRICCRDLSDGPGGQWGCTMSGQIAIDPMLGRIQFAADVPVPKQLLVSYTYGSGGYIGGGAYVRTVNPPAHPTFTATVGTAPFPTLESAIAAWNALAPGAVGIIYLPGFNTVGVDLTGAAAIALPSTSQLWILAAEIHPDGAASFESSCTTLTGNIQVNGVQILGSGGSVLPPGQLFISGLWISGSLTIAGDPSSVNLMDSTLVPGISLARDGKPVEPGEPSLVASAIGVALTLSDSISGPIGLAAGGSACLSSSIIDSCGPGHIAYAGSDLASEGADLRIEDCTVIGKLWTRTMQLASNTIFLARRPRFDPWKAAVWSSRRQVGCVRFCFLPNDSITPKRYRCLPDDPSQEHELWPSFITLQYGQPSYAMLSGYVAMAVWTGADDGAEMGAFHGTEETLGIRNVQLCAPEFLPVGLEAGIFLEPSEPIVKPRVHHAYGYGYGMPTGTPRDADGDTDELAYMGIGAHLI
ncbi:MAG: hypothetical protein ABSE59_04250 [Opitutaceae bacterium]|jgi:hypothetical protein